MTNQVQNSFKTVSKLLLGAMVAVVLTATLLLNPINANAQAASDIYVIDESKAVFSPARGDAPKFKSADLVVTVSDSRIQNGATCDIKVRPWPTAATPNPAFINTNLTAINTTYDGSCRATLPAANQSTYLWEFQIRITSQGRTYGVDTSYFFLFGAAVVVQISGVTQ